MNDALIIIHPLSGLVKVITGQDEWLKLRQQGWLRAGTIYAEYVSQIKVGNLDNPPRNEETTRT